jgi:hypothetical protein
MGWAFSLFQFFIERLRTQAFGLLDTKAGQNGLVPFKYLTAVFEKAPLAST